MSECGFGLEVGQLRGMIVAKTEVLRVFTSCQSMCSVCIVRNSKLAQGGGAELFAEGIIERGEPREGNRTLKEGQGEKEKQCYFQVLKYTKGGVCLGICGRWAQERWAG